MHLQKVWMTPRGGVHARTLNLQTLGRRFASAHKSRPGIAVSRGVERRLLAR